MDADAVYSERQRRRPFCFVYDIGEKVDMEDLTYLLETAR